MTIIRTFCAALIGLVLIGAGPPPLSKADDNSLRAAIKAIYAPYSLPSRETESTARPVYSARTRALITRWSETRPLDEVTPMAESDWFCQCQDWDPAATRLRSILIKPRTPNRAEAKATYMIGWDEDRSLRFLMIREGGKWKVDDLLYDDEYVSLTTQLRKEIAEAGGK
jgi:Protein of unknown function (DUF3828)